MMRGLFYLALFLLVPLARSESDEHENQNVGANKGIIAVDDHEGFQISVEAFKNFDLRFLKLARAPWTLPRSSVLQSGEEVNVFRYRAGFFKRVDFKLVRKTATEIVITAEELQEGDEIVVNGVGFLRVVELVAAGGSIQHSH